LQRRRVKSLGSVLLGDRIIWKIYQAIRSSHSATGNNWQNTRDAPLNDLQISIINAIRKFYVDDPAMRALALVKAPIMTVGAAKEVLKQAEKLRHRGGLLAR